MEESLTLDELYLLIKVQQEGEYSRRRFNAAIQGIDLDDEESDEVSKFDEVRQQADAILGVEEDEVLGLFGLNDEDDE